MHKFQFKLTFLNFNMCKFANKRKTINNILIPNKYINKNTNFFNIVFEIL